MKLGWVIYPSLKTLTRGLMTSGKRLTYVCNLFNTVCD